MMHPHFQVFGHRGVIYPSKVPYENSLKAYALSLRAQDGFECDVCSTKDGALFLAHEAKYADPTRGVEYALAEHLDEKSAYILGQKRLEDLNEVEAKTLRLRDGQPLPMLAEVLPLFTHRPQKTLIAELKGAHVVAPLIALLLEAFAAKTIRPQQVVIGGFNHGAVQAVKRALPLVRTNLTFIEAATPSVPMFPWVPKNTAKYQPFTFEGGYIKTLFSTFLPDYVMVPHQAIGGEVMAILAKQYPSVQHHAWVFTERAAGLDEKALLQKVAHAYHTHNLTGIIIDLPEKTALYKQACA